MMEEAVKKTRGIPKDIKENRYYYRHREEILARKKACRESSEEWKEKQKEKERRRREKEEEKERKKEETEARRRERAKEIERLFKRKGESGGVPVLAE